MGVAPFADHFSKVAANYATFRPRYPGELFEWLAEIAPRRGVVWDCATGNGQAATALAEIFERIIATDASADQIGSAVRHPRIEYQTASAESSGLPDASADLITVAQAAHWFDLERFYREAKRVGKADAVLALWCYGEMHFGDPTIDAALSHYYNEVVGPYWPPERRFVEEGYRTLHFPFREIHSPCFRIQAEFRLRDLAGYLRTWSATQRHVKAKGFDPVVAIEEELGRHWPEEEVRKAVDWPVTVRAARLHE